MDKLVFLIFISVLSKFYLDKIRKSRDKNMDKWTWTGLEDLQQESSFSILGFLLKKRQEKRALLPLKTNGGDVNLASL